MRGVLRSRGRRSGRNSPQSSWYCTSRVGRGRAQVRFREDEFDEETGHTGTVKPESQGGSGAVWWTVALTALAAPIGSAVVALVLGQLVTVSSGGGMEDLAAVVVGLWLGAPLVALGVFGGCVFTLLKGVPLRRWLALSLMAAVAVLEALLMMAGLRVADASGWPRAGVVVVAVIPTLVLGFGSYAAIRWARP